MQTGRDSVQMGPVTTQIGTVTIQTEPVTTRRAAAVRRVVFTPLGDECEANTRPFGLSGQEEEFYGSGPM